ncbi:hypothetical protein AB3G34_05040 [Flavobacterium sp. WC2409]|uniref:Lipoprotein n=1 Tax=Flavobacterium sp. WC2409 TaxID=3234139 RepID=A0AB39W7K8_9FLAO
MKNILLLISFILLLGCKNENNLENENTKSKTQEVYSEIVDNKLVYAVINSALLNRDKENIIKNCDAVINRKTTVFINYDSTFIKKFDTIFNENEKKFILKQYKNGNHFILDQSFVENKKVIEIDTTIFYSEKKKKSFWKKINEDNKCISFIYVPLFNLKKDLAIVECGTRGETGIFIYKLESNGKWKLNKTVEKIIE